MEKWKNIFITQNLKNKEIDNKKKFLNSKYKYTVLLFDKNKNINFLLKLFKQFIYLTKLKN